MSYHNLGSEMSFLGNEEYKFFNGIMNKTQKHKLITLTFLITSHVADFALRKTSLDGSYLCAGSVLASFMVKTLERVPFRSRLGQKAVLFYAP